MPGCNYGALNPGPWDCDPNPWAYTMVQPPQQCNNDSGYNCTFVFGVTINGNPGQIIATGSSSRVYPGVLRGTPTLNTTTAGAHILRMEFDTCYVPCSPICRVNVTAVERNGLPYAYMNSERVFCPRFAVELNVGAWDFPTTTAANFPLEIYVEFVSQ